MAACYDSQNTASLLSPTFRTKSTKSLTHTPCFGDCLRRSRGNSWNTQTMNLDAYPSQYCLPSQFFPSAFRTPWAQLHMLSVEPGNMKQSWAHPPFCSWHGEAILACTPESNISRSPSSNTCPAMWLGNILDKIDRSDSINGHTFQHCWITS